MRTTKELLTIVLKHSYAVKKFDGICGLIHNLRMLRIITPKEAILLGAYIQNNRPVRSDSRVHWFYGNFFKESQVLKLYFFEPYKKNIRKAWLKHLIKTCK